MLPQPEFDLSTAQTLSVEICVIGGGPAGSSVARRLAMLGHEVCLIERNPFPRPHIGESLPPSILPVLDLFELRPRVEQAGFLRSQGAIVRWGSATDRKQYQPGEPGFQVNRARFDQLLLAAAEEVGVRVLQPAQAKRPHRSVEGWIIPLRGHKFFRTVHARFMIDAAGKHANLGRSRKCYSARTIALYGYWFTPHTVGTETRVEAGRRAWYWGAPLPEGSFNAAVFLEPEQCMGLSAASRNTKYCTLLAKSKLLRSCLQGRLLSKINVCDASSYVDEEPISSNAIKVGEANFSIDPLSSQGVQSAMVSAFQASLAVHTQVTNPANTEAAIAFYGQRQRENVQQHERLSRRFYAAQNTYAPNPFWRDRTQVLSDFSQQAEFDLNTAELHGQQRLKLAATVKLESTPLVENNIIAWGTALHHFTLQRPVVYLGGVAVAALLQRVAPGGQATEIITHWASYVSPQQGQEILRWLWIYKVVVPWP